MLRLLGLDVLDLTIETDANSTEPGDATSQPVGFALPAMPAEFELDP